MMKSATIFLVWSLAAVTAQNAPSASPTASAGLPPGFGQGQAQLRSEVDPSLFETSFSASTSQTSGSDSFGSVRFLLGQSNPALSTLSNNGLAQGIVTLNACALWAPHYHPRANEILYVSEGNLSIAFREENPVTSADGTMYGGRLLPFSVPAGSSVVIPQGLIHYAYNPTCDPATIVTSFDNKDPGTVSIAQQLFSLPQTIVATATGLTQVDISTVQDTITKTPIIAGDGSKTDCSVMCSTAKSATAPAAGAGK